MTEENLTTIPQNEEERQKHEIKRLELQARSGFNARSAEYLARMFGNPDNPNVRFEEILDLGVGGGDVLPVLVPYLAPSGIAVGIDVDGSRLNAARKVAATLGFDKKVALLEGNATGLVLPDDSIQLVYARLFWHHLPEDQRYKALSEVYRVLEKGGRVVFEDADKLFDAWKTFPASEAHDQIKEAGRVFYQREGKESLMGSKLPSFLESVGFKVKDKSSYIIETSGNDPFKRAHLGIATTFLTGAIELGIVTKEEADLLITQFQNDLLKPETTIWVSPIVQITAAKE